MMFGAPWSMEGMTFPPFVFFLTVAFGVMVVFALAWPLTHYKAKQYIKLPHLLTKADLPVFLILRPNSESAPTFISEFHSATCAFFTMPLSLSFELSSDQW